MDNTLFQLVRALFDAHQKIDELSALLRQLQADYTDLKQKFEKFEPKPVEEKPKT